MSRGPGGTVLSLTALRLSRGESPLGFGSSIDWNVQPMEPGFDHALDHTKSLNTTARRRDGLRELRSGHGSLSSLQAFSAFVNHNPFPHVVC
jgi:hypothetical protein